MDHYISRLKKNTPIKKNQYFSELIRKKTTFKKFQKTQLDFYDAVTFFTKPMFVIASKLDSYEERLIILENIMDEHGEGELSQTHGETFRQYLLSLGILEEEIFNRRQNRATKVFNNLLLKKANEKSIFFSLAMIGIIEDRYVGITKLLSEHLIKNKWLKKETLIHYRVHEGLDIKHAESFYNLIRKHWVKAEKQIDIKEGLVFGNNLILNFYSSLL